MAATTYSVVIDDSYMPPAGALTKEQYVAFVMNRAAESYMQQYGEASADAGIQAACAAYNAAIAIPEPSTQPS